MCQVCERQLCPDCVTLQKAGYTDVLYCVPCGGGPKRIMNRRDQIPFLARVPQAFLFPLTTVGFLTMAGGGVDVSSFKVEFLARQIQ